MLAEGKGNVFTQKLGSEAFSPQSRILSAQAWDSFGFTSVASAVAGGARLSTFAFPVDGQETLQQNSDHPWEIPKTLLNNLDIIPSVQLQVRQARGAALRYMSVLKK